MNYFFLYKIYMSFPLQSPAWCRCSRTSLESSECVPVIERLVPLRTVGSSLPGTHQKYTGRFCSIDRKERSENNPEIAYDWHIHRTIRGKFFPQGKLMKSRCLPPWQHCFGWSCIADNGFRTRALLRNHTKFGFIIRIIKTAIPSINYIIMGLPSTLHYCAV